MTSHGALRVRRGPSTLYALSLSLRIAGRRRDPRAKGPSNEYLSTWWERCGPPTRGTASQPVIEHADAESAREGRWQRKAVQTVGWFAVLTRRRGQ